MEPPHIILFSSSESRYLFHIIKYLNQFSLNPYRVYIGSPTYQLYSKCVSLYSSLSHTGLFSTVDRLLFSRSMEHSVNVDKSNLRDVNLFKFDYFTSIDLLQSLQSIQGPKIGVAAGCGIIDQLLINQFDGQIVNAHPAILPGFRGVDVVYHSLIHDVDLGVSTHFVNSKVDSGSIIDVKQLPKHLFGCSFTEFMERLVEFQASVLASSVEHVIRCFQNSYEVKTYSNNPERSKLVHQVSSSERRKAIRAYNLKYSML